MSLQAQEAQYGRQAQQALRMRVEWELTAREQGLRERARETRVRMADMKESSRTTRIEENKAIGERVRQDSRRLMAALQMVREQTHQSKQMQVEVLREQRRQQKLRKQLELTRREQ